MDARGSQLNIGFCSTAAENAMEEMVARTKAQGGNAVARIEWLVDGGSYPQPSCKTYFPFVVGIPWWGALAKVQGMAIIIDPATLPVVP